ncbi:50S ribosome-binding GTPase [Rhodococcus antarcticus]|uniref:50S ribosome-binding GTPase n=1 Tax=Rhodococcus antarcticus TaxID=2987751 RepID=A0ABY6P0P3_9NOCA|nr:GTPase [Rhodococcus antarcticus]UZJ24836.1 50S ribosome-binding GTPase [Rhodococcus antarcticus]
MTTPVSAGAAPSTLPTEVRTARAQLTALLGEAVRPASTPTPDTPTVVVVGETGRGKSSLVNALLHSPGASPVDAAGPTPVHIVLAHAEVPVLTVHRVGCAPLTVDPAALTSWNALLAALPQDGPPPRHVELGLPVPLLEHLTLVDTPGVGGLDGLHSGLAEVAAAGATALLVVLDAGAPLTHPELDLLARLGRDVDTVLLALTRTDVHRGWREVLAADRALLARHVPRLAGVVVHPVSSRLAAAADSAPTPELARVLREQSGIAVLQAELQRTVARRAVMLGEANGLRALHSALVAVARAARTEARALQSGEGAPAELRTRRTELVQQRRSGARAATLRLRAEVQRARVESTHEVAAGVRETQGQFRAAVDAADRERLELLPAQLDPALGALALRVSASLAQRLQRVSALVLAEVFTAEEVAGLDSTPPVPHVPVPAARPVEKRVSASEDRLMVVAGASGGVGLGKLALAPLALVPGLNLVLVPLTLGLGAGAAWWMARARGHVADRAHVRQWAAEVLADARSSLDQLVAEQLIDTEHQLGAALDDALARRVAQLDAELRDVDAALRLDAGERARLARAADARHAELLAGAQRAAALLERLAAVRDRR